MSLDIEPLAAPILAFRAWRLSADGMLKSLYVGDGWTPGVNEIVTYPGGIKATQLGWPQKNHDCPGTPVHDCMQCGFYAYKHPELVAQEWPVQVYGIVELWGRVFEHSLGFRASHGRIRSLVISTIWKAPAKALHSVYEVPVTRCRSLTRGGLVRKLTKQAALIH